MHIVCINIVFYFLKYIFNDIYGDTMHFPAIFHTSKISLSILGQTESY